MGEKNRTKNLLGQDYEFEFPDFRTVPEIGSISLLDSSNNSEYTKLMVQLQKLQSEIIACTKCGRLVKWREKVAREKVKRFSDDEYWGKPLPGFGDPAAELLIVGLAPAAHGGNRTGRMFTGDRSGDWLFQALHTAGFANQPTSTDRNDGLRLHNCYITACCRCAPPQNKLRPEEIKNCRPFLEEEMRLLKNVRLIIGLGKIGFDAAARTYAQLAGMQSLKKIRFGHGVLYPLDEKVTLIGSFHPSQQNTFTGRLTRAMFHSIFRRARQHVKESS